MKESLLPGVGTGELRQDRRSTIRVARLYRPIEYETHSFRGIAILRNISERGMMATLHTRLVSDTEITVMLGEVRVRAQVIWRKEDTAGFEFAEPIDVAVFLGSLGVDQSSGQVARAARLNTNCQAVLIRGGDRFSARALNISQRGVLVATENVQTGDGVAIEIEGLPRRRAEVKWAAHERAGLSFYTPITARELAEWACVYNTFTTRS